MQLIICGFIFALFFICKFDFENIGGTDVLLKVECDDFCCVNEFDTRNIWTHNNWRYI